MIDGLATILAWLFARPLVMLALAIVAAGLVETPH